MTVQQDLASGARSDTRLLEVDSLNVSYTTKSGELAALRDVSIALNGGETLGIVGESGSGKSTLALAILQYLGANGRIKSGSIQFDGQELTDLSKAQLRKLRGNEIAHVPQDPASNLNPGITVGEQIAETIREHKSVSPTEAKERTLEILKEVQIADPAYNYDRYPHELSGGMKQRILVAIALCCDPKILVLDEPTTGLDVTTQAKILDLVKDLKESLEAGILLITHDLSVIAETCDRMMVLYAGEMMEKGRVEDIFANPTNPYTRGLLSVLPRLDTDVELTPIPGQLPSLIGELSGCIFADRCEFATDECRTTAVELESVNRETDHETRCLRWEHVVDQPISTGGTRKQKRRVEDPETVLDADTVRKYFGKKSFFDRLFEAEQPIKAVDGVDIEILEGETHGLVGESGCGKSTLGECLLRLLKVEDGTIRYDGEDISNLDGADLRNFRSNAQIVFQNPNSSLNPRNRVGKQLARPLELFTDLDGQERKERVSELLKQVNLEPNYASRYPHELSGGEIQRIAIARAFAANPSFIVLDEPVSALDVSVQAGLLNLLSMLQEDYNSAYLFVSHDLSVVKYISDRITVMYLGHVMETGTTAAIFDPPYHPYTRALLSANPSADPHHDKKRVRLEGDVPSARDPPSGCPFHTRCPQYIGEVCESEVPELESKQSADDSHRIACHLGASELNTEI